MRCGAVELTPKAKLHASLALLPVDRSQLRVPGGEAARRVARRDARAARCSGHRTVPSLTPKLWSVLEAAKPDDRPPVPAAGALAVYDPESPNWQTAAEKWPRLS